MTTIWAIVALVLIVLVVPVPLRWGLVALVGVLYLMIFGLGVAFIRFQFFANALCRGAAQKRIVALTFDDGPDPVTTPMILDTLKTAGVHATFFCIGDRVREHVAIAKRIDTEGHLIGNHTSTHSSWTNFLFGNRLDAAYRGAQDSIFTVTGSEPRYCRSPMGLTNPHYKGMLNRLGLKLVGWDVRAFDKMGRSAEAIAHRVLRGVRPGSIIALHDAGVSTEVVAELLPSILNGLRDDGYTFVRVDKLNLENIQ